MRSLQEEQLATAAQTAMERVNLNKQMMSDHLKPPFYGLLPHALFANNDRQKAMQAVIFQSVTDVQRLLLPVQYHSFCPNRKRLNEFVLIQSPVRWIKCHIYLQYSNFYFTRRIELSETCDIVR